LGGLEDELDPALEFAAHFAQRGGHAERDHGVYVVAAGVHLSRHLGCEGEPGLLMDRQRVHVGADADGASGFGPLQHRDDTGTAHALFVANTQLVQKRRDGFRRLVLFERELGVLVQRLAQSDELRRQSRRNRVDTVHQASIAPSRANARTPASGSSKRAFIPSSAAARWYSAASSAVPSTLNSREPWARSSCPIRRPERYEADAVARSSPIRPRVRTPKRWCSV